MRPLAGRDDFLRLHISIPAILLAVLVCSAVLSCADEAENLNDSADVFAEAGAAYRNGDLNTCRELLLEVTVTDPENPNVWRNLGTVSLDMGLYDEAVSAYWMVIEIDSSRVDVLTDVTGALLGAGRIEEAMHTGGLAVQFNPADGLAFNNYGMVLMEIGNYEEAASCFNTALHREPENPSILYNCGRITLMTGDAEGALAFFRSATAIDPEFIKPRIEAARTLGMLGRHQEAEDEILTVLAMSPENPEAMNILALSYSARDRVDEAVSVLESLLENNPDDPASRLGLAECLYNNGDITGALQNYRLFISSLADTSGTSYVRERITELEAICDQP